METEKKILKTPPPITESEVTDWENKFRESVSPLVQFYEQDNGHSMKFYNGESGVDAFWAGIIALKGEKYIKWTFSMLEGVTMEAKVILDETNYKIPSGLYDFFKSWQVEVAKSITEPESAQGTDGAGSPPPQNPDLAGPESNNAPETPIGGPPPMSEGLLVGKKNVIPSRVDKSRKDNIMDSAERMRRLAGLY